MLFELIYGDTTINAEVINKSFSKKEVFYNNLKQADNTCRFQAVFTIELANFIKSHVSDNIKCIVSENSTIIFNGFLRKNFNFTKTQINQAVSLEVVNPSFFLDKTKSNGTAFVNKSIGFIVDAIVKETGYNLIGQSVAGITHTPPVTIIEADSNYKDILNTLLFEYGYTWDFDTSGVFQVYPLFNIPDTSEIAGEFNGNNILEQVSITAKDHEADHVKANYNKIEYHENVLIFHDSTNADKNNSCYQVVKGNKYFADTQYNYLDCDSTAGKVIYIASLTRSDVLADSTYISFEAAKTDLDPANNNRDLINQICFTAKNNNAGIDYHLTRIDFYGNVYTSKGDEYEVFSFGEEKEKNITLKYVCEKDKAEAFTQNYTNWMRFATNTISLKSKTDYPVGEFVKVTDYGIGTYYGRIISKETRLDSVSYSYTIETITEYTPASVSSKNNTSNNILSAIEGAKQSSNKYTDDAITQAEIEASPRYELVFNSTTIRKLADNSYSPATITAQARKIQGDSSAMPYNGVFRVYLNGQNEPYGSATAGNTLNINLADIAAYVNEINSIRVEFNNTADNMLIDHETILVLSNPNAYSIQLENGYSAFICDSDGKVKANEITVKPHVYYGLSEIPFGAEGWEFTYPPEKTGFTFEIDYISGAIKVKTVDGANIEEHGNIGINLYIHSSEDTPYHIGYISGADEEIYIGYEDSGASYEIGYTVPAESGIYTCYFSYSKMSELGLLLRQETSTSSSNYGQLVVDGSKIKVGSVEAAQIKAGAITADKIKAGSITATQINTESLFATDINATNMHLSGNSEIEGKVSATKFEIISDYVRGASGNGEFITLNNETVYLNAGTFLRRGHERGFVSVSSGKIRVYYDGTFANGRGTLSGSIEIWKSGVRGGHTTLYKQSYSNYSTTQHFSYDEIIDIEVGETIYCDIQVSGTNSTDNSQIVHYGVYISSNAETYPTLRALTNYKEFEVYQ